MRKSYQNFAARLGIMFLIASARAMSAQGNPDIVWQGTHTGFVRYTAFSPDGQQLASGGDDKKNKLWQTSDGTLLRTITPCSGLSCNGPTLGIYSPDSQQLATSGLKFWRVSDGTLIRTLGIGGTVAFSPDFQNIASSVTTSSYPSQTRTITSFRASDGSQVWTKPSAGGGATSFSADGQLVASIGFQGIDIFQASDGSLVRNIVGPRGNVLAFSRDGQFLATNGGAGGSYRYDQTIKIYRVSDGALVRTFTATGTVTSIVFTPDGQTMIAGSSDSNEDPVNGFLPATGTIRFWRVSDGALLKTYDQNTGTSANAVAVSADGHLFSYSHDSTVVVARIPDSFCAFSISPTSANLPESGGSGSVNVIAPPGCSWSATSRVDWITLTGNTSGTGNGTVTYSASGGSEITGSLIIAEQAFPIHLGSDPCSYAVSPTTATWSSFGGTGGVGVQALSGCGWSAASNDSWITITKIKNDSGSGGLTYSVAPNSGSSRTGTLTVAGQTVTIEQVTDSCSYSVTPASQSFGSTGGPGNISITTLSGCPWTVTTDSSWITLGVGNGSGSGSTTVTYWVNGNETTATRTGTITAAGQVITITQEGITCGYDISPASRWFTSDGGDAYVNMAAAEACGWTASSNDSWITITSGGSGSGWGTIYYSVAPNGSGSPRTGTISIVGQTFTVFQGSEATLGSPSILWTGTGHEDQVNAVAFSPDGQLLASASDDGTVKLWRVSDGELLDTLTGHFKQVTSLAFSHNGEMLTSGSIDRSIKLWRVSDRTLIRSMGSSEFILGVCFSPDDTQITSGGGYSTNEIKVWRLSDGENISITHDMLGATNSVAYSPDGQFLATGKANSVATLRNVETWNVDWLGHNGSVNFVAFSPNSQVLATASDDQSASLWQVVTGLPLFNLNGPSGFVKSVGFSPDGETVIAAGQDYGAGHGTILFWRVSDGALLRAYTQQTSTVVFSAQFSPDGNLFAYGREDGVVVVARNLLNVGPSPTPTPTPPPGATPTPTPGPTNTPGVTPSPSPEPEPTATPSATPGSAPAQPLNISTRLRVQGGDNALIGGFILTGSDSKGVLIRALGPSLGASGMSGALSDTTLELYDSSGQLIASNDDWKDSQQPEIQNTGVAPNDALESAILTTLSGNSSYTAVVRGKNGASGIGLVEVYDLGLIAGSKLGNISTRGFIDTGDNVMIGGFIVGGNGPERTRMIVRALGPSLSGLGLANALPDPTLTLHDSNGNVIASNDNWREALQPEIEAAGLAPRDDRESALFASLAPGAYTAIVAGKANTTGIGLVEAYHIH